MSLNEHWVMSRRCDISDGGLLRAMSKLRLPNAKLLTVELDSSSCRLLLTEPRCSITMLDPPSRTLWIVFVQRLLRGL